MNTNVVMYMFNQQKISYSTYERNKLKGEVHQGSYLFETREKDLDRVSYAYKISFYS